MRLLLPRSCGLMVAGVSGYANREHHGEPMSGGSYSYLCHEDFSNAELERMASRLVEKGGHTW